MNELRQPPHFDEKEHGVDRQVTGGIVIKENA